MTYYVSKVFWLLAAPTSALVLMSAIAALWAVLRSSKCAAWLAAAAACGLAIATFTPVGLALRIPLEHRFVFLQPNLQALPDGIIFLAGSGGDGIDAVPALSQKYPKARLTFSIYMEPHPRSTYEDALYSAALLKPKPSERWLLVTAALHMPRAVGCFRVAGFQVEPYPVQFMTGDPTAPFAFFRTGSLALNQFDTAAKEWIGLIAYWLMGNTDTLFPGPTPGANPRSLH